jgi:methylmalonyl-CoA mutase
VIKAANYDIIILETSGMGNLIRNYGPFDVSLYVMTPNLVLQPNGKKSKYDFADLVAINKFDKRGSRCVRDVKKKQYQRNHNLWDANLDTLPVLGPLLRSSTILE